MSQWWRKIEANKTLKWLQRIAAKPFNELDFKKWHFCPVGLCLVPDFWVTAHISDLFSNSYEWSEIKWQFNVIIRLRCFLSRCMPRRITDMAPQCAVIKETTSFCIYVLPICLHWVERILNSIWPEHTSSKTSCWSAAGNWNQLLLNTSVCSATKRAQ